MPDEGREQHDAPPPTPSEAPAPITESLEERLRRLEAAVARLTSSRDGETPPWQGPRALPGPDPVDPLEDVKPLPRATPIPPVPTASLADFALPSVPLPPPVPESSFQAIMRPLQGPVLHRVLPPSALLRDLWWDLRTGWRMVRDPYYPMTMAGKFVPLFALFYVCVWPWFSSWTGLVGIVMSGLVNIVVLYITFKVIQRELRRYYEFSQRYRRP